MTDLFNGTDHPKFPDTPIPDQDLLFPEGQYFAVVGKLMPLYLGITGKKTTADDPDGVLANIVQELWITECTEDFGTPKQRFVKRIEIKDNIVTFTRGDSRGVKMLESFPTPQNRTIMKSGKTAFEALAWKAKAFYSSFEDVIVGEKGQKRIVWEAVKQYYGCSIMFNIYYSIVDGKNYRNITKVRLFPKHRLDAEIMAKIETLYHQIKSVESENQNTEPTPASSVDDILGVSNPQNPAEDEDLPF